MNLIKQLRERMLVAGPLWITPQPLWAAISHTSGHVVAETARTSEQSSSALAGALLDASQIYRYGSVHLSLDVGPQQRVAGEGYLRVSTELPSGLLVELGWLRPWFGISPAADAQLLGISTERLAQVGEARAGIRWVMDNFRDRRGELTVTAGEHNRPETTGQMSWDFGGATSNRLLVAARSHPGEAGGRLHVAVLSQAATASQNSLSLTRSTVRGDFSQLWSLEHTSQNTDALRPFLQIVGDRGRSRHGLLAVLSPLFMKRSVSVQGFVTVALTQYLRPMLPRRVWRGSIGVGVVW